MRTILNHNPEAWAGQYLAISKTATAHASEIESSTTAHPLVWHVHCQLQALASLAFDIQGCIHLYNDEQESEMQTITFTPLTSKGFGEICETLDDLIVAVDREIDSDPLSVNLQNIKTALSNAIRNINVADEQIRLFHQRREDSDARRAIIDVLNGAYGSEANVGPAESMLQDIASPNGAELILQAIRDAGYAVTSTPQAPF